MGPKKRKTPPAKSQERPRKKPATKKAKSDATSEGEPVPPVKPNKGKTSSNSAKAIPRSEKKPVQWILPKNCDIKIKKAFAPLLFGQAWEGIINRSRAVLDLPHLPSPIHAEDSAEESEAEREQRVKKFRISEELLVFHKTVWERNEDYIGNDAGERDGLIGFSEEVPARLRGDQEGMLNITRRRFEGTIGDSASIKIIQRTAPGGNSELFIVLGQGQKIWVNNREIENKATKNDDSAMYIGPLGNFAILEVLQAPIFLWRNRTDASSETTADIPRTASKLRDSEAGDAETSVTFTNPDNAGPGTRKRRNSKSASGGDRRRTSGNAPNWGTFNELINSVILAVSNLQPEVSGGFALEVDDSLVRPGQTWILPVRPLSHTVLVVIQYVPSAASESGDITIHVLDPMQRDCNENIRDEIWKVVTGWDILQRWMPGIGLDLKDLRTALPDHAYWVASPAAIDDEEVYAITILNAWLLAMGLNINPNWTLPRELEEEGAPVVESRSSRADFFEKAEGLFNLAKKDMLTWEDVYKFAKEQEYILDKGPPRPDRQFDFQTIPLSRIQESQVSDQIKYEQSIKMEGSAESSYERTARREAYVQRANSVRVDFSGDKTRYDEVLRTDQRDEPGVRILPSQDLNRRVHIRTNLANEQLRKSHNNGPPPAASQAPRPTSTTDSGRLRPQDPPQKRQTTSDERSKGSSGKTLPKSVAPDGAKLTESLDPCSFLEMELERLEKTHKVKAGAKKIELNTLSIAKTIAAVSQAVAHVAGPQSGLECVEYDLIQGMRAVSPETRYRGIGLTLFPISLKNVIKAGEGNAYESRSALAVVQPLYQEGSEQQESQTRRFSVHVFDHAPWLSNPESRNATNKMLLDLIRRITALEKIEIEGGNISWIVTPPPSDPNKAQLSYYTILNAWTICLGLHANQEFRALSGFFEQATDIIRVVLSGHADWRLIWSFLRCHEYVLDEEVPEARRFGSTVAEKELHANLNQLRSRALEERTPEIIVAYDMPTIATSFPTDTWGFDDRDSLARAITYPLRVGISIADLDATALEEANKQKSPCAIFRADYQRLVKMHAEKITPVKNSIDPGEVRDMRTEDVSRSLASVILAVTKKQDLYGGLNWAGMNVVDKMTQPIEDGSEENLDLWREFAVTDDPTARRPIRYSRPVILTTNFDHHLTLMVIQYDAQQRIEITVLDSMPWRTIKRRHRAWMRTLASSLIKLWKWNDEKYREVSAESSDPEIGDVRWAPCAYQTTQTTCGYHTILNGWAAALGLRLNTRFKQSWDYDFLEQTHNVISLALLGKASSDMIHNFLDCINFVEPRQEIDKSKRFEHTFVGTSYANIYEKMRPLVEDDQAWWMLLEGEKRVKEIKKIRRDNRIDFLDNRGFNSEWPFDRWDEAFPMFVPDLVKEAQHVLDISELDGNQLFYQLVLRSREFKDLQGYTLLKPQHFNDPLKEYGRQIRKGRLDSTMKEFHTFIRLDTLDQDFIEKNARRVYELHRECLQRLLDASPAQDGKHGLHFDNVLQATAAVLQAIDNRDSHQAEQDKKTYAGGFALTSEAALTDGQGPLSRPRRCWLLPWLYHEKFYDKRFGETSFRAHFFLAVVQEEERASGKGSQFCVYFLDSAPHMWETREDARFDQFELIKKKARDLGWTSHRNPNNQIKFCSKPRYVRVAKQSGNIICGYHCVVNVWILALGMTPKVAPRSSLKLDEAREMVRFAVRGVLDSKTLIAWLFSRDLTVEKRIGPVTMERSFDATVEQQEENGDEQLSDSVRTAFQIYDAPLEQFTEAEVPYARNNVGFTGEHWRFEAEETLEEDEEDEQDNHESDGDEDGQDHNESDDNEVNSDDDDDESEDDEPAALHRIVEDVDMLDYEYDDDDEEWSSFFGDLAKTAYKDRRKDRRRNTDRASMGFTSSGVSAREYNTPSRGRGTRMYR